MTTTGKYTTLPDWLATLLWTLVALVVLDQALDRAFPLPADPRVPPSQVASYLDGGRSVEAKLRRMFSTHDTLAAPVTLSGWVDPVRWPADRPLESGRRFVTVFGPSFALAVGDTLESLHPHWQFRARGGPAAPVSHVYALWRVDRSRVHSDVAVLGILASSLRGVDAASGATWMFESPYPYTYPRWRVEGDSVSGEWPSLASSDSMRAALASPARWRAYEGELARTDAWYRPALFRASWLDHSVTFRLLRKAWAQRETRLHTARLHDRHGFKPGAEALRTARALAIQFAREVRADGGVPVVMLIEDRGYDDHLERALGADLRAAGVPCMSTHGIAPPTDPGTFTADAHFRGELNQRLAAALDSLIREASGPGGGNPSETVPR
ncbi:MAG: hypothetical protein HZA61_05895 [Candidatus Eisenbacteria bacterium]|uniref:Uncharacterized protein n=1 Tax=Eiseniibacteriota bacterium TaxID=2212470 RepID=A0A933SEL4_UNCEI|nr:hypothetical protein [Candidatus Eisenbacteria bacterium]